MPADLPGDITTLLDRWREGDSAALQSLTSLTYEDLRSIATGFLRRERPEHTLQTTALVNELYLRLAGQKGVRAADRAHFYTFSAMMMRRILTDYARRSLAEKRPARADRVPLHPDVAWVDASGEEMVALDQALDELEKTDARVARAIELRYILGCTSQEASQLLDVSTATIDRDVKFGTAWLYRRLSGTKPDPT
jgi:RNA polymerase sigma factor (TIGR02999 family)